MSNIDPWGSFNFSSPIAQSENAGLFNPFASEQPRQPDPFAVLDPISEGKKAEPQQTQQPPPRLGVPFSPVPPSSSKPFSPIPPTNPTSPMKGFSPVPPTSNTYTPIPQKSPNPSPAKPEVNNSPARQSPVNSQNASFASTTSTKSSEPFSPLPPSTPQNLSVSSPFSPVPPSPASTASITAMSSPASIKDNIYSPVPSTPVPPTPRTPVDSTPTSTPTKHSKDPFETTPTTSTPTRSSKDPFESPTKLGTPPAVQVTSPSATPEKSSDPFKEVLSPPSDDSISSPTISNIENDPFAPDAPKNPFAMVTYSSPTAIIAVSPTSNPFDLEHDSPFDEENKKEKVSKFGIEAPKASTAAKTLFAVDGEKQMSKMTSAVVAKMESTIQAVVPVPVHSVVKKIGKGKNERQGLRADDEDDEEEEEEEYLPCVYCSIHVSPSSSPPKTASTSTAVSPAATSPSSANATSSSGVSQVSSSNPFAHRELLLANPFSPTAPFASLFHEEPIFSVGESQDEDEDEKIRQAKRLHTLKDMWESEKQYVADLEVIVNMYLIPLRDSLKNRRTIIDEKDVPKLFCNVEVLLSLNSEVGTQLDIILEKGFEKAQVQRVLKEIAQVFIKMKTNFRAYAEYCIHNTVAIDFYQQLQKRQTFVSYEELTMKSHNNEKLEKFLIKPVTRIPRYMWFLKELMRHTKQEEEASDPLLKSYEAMKSVMTYINEHKLQKENTAKLQEIEKSLTGYKEKIVVPGRTLVREGLLQRAEKDKKPVSMIFYLFSDCMMWAEDNGKSFKYKDQVPMHQLLVKDIPDMKYPFQIKRLDKKKDNVFTVFCKSEPEKNLWVADLKKIIDEVTLKQDKSAQLAKALQWQEFTKEIKM